MNHCTRFFIAAALLISVFIPAKVSAQYVTIPDANFSSYLNGLVPGCMNGNQLDTTCSSLPNFTTLLLYNQGILDLTGIRHFPNVTNIGIWGNPMTTLPTLPPNLEIVNGYQCNISSLPNNLPASLIRLRLDDNNLSSLPTLPAGLEVLNLNTNNFTSVPGNLPAGLKELHISYNSITSVTAPLPPNLEWLSLAYNSSSLTSIGTPLPSTLKIFDCSNNGLTTAPIPPASLESYYVHQNQLTSIPTLPTGLKHLGIARNYNLVPPATLPPTLEGLGMGSVNTTTLPPLPATLTQIECKNLNLTSLPTLPPGLVLLWAHDNDLTSLPTLPSTLRDARFPRNQLTSLPTLPASLQQFDVLDNQISCFPLFPSGITSLVITNNPYTCLPNYIPAMSSALINSTPLCVVGDPINNPNNCANGIGINGLTYEDTNGNCAANAGEPGVEYVPMHLYDGSGTFLETTFSTGTGGYYFSPQAGTYRVDMDLTQTPFLQAVCSAGTTANVTTTTAAPVQGGIDFDVECNGFDAGVQSVAQTGWVFPGQNHILHVWAGDLSQFNGLECATGISGQVEIVVTGPVTYIGPGNGAQTPTISGSTYTYAVSDFATVSLHSDFKLLFSTDTTAQSGDTVCVNVTVTSGAGDIDPSNNTAQRCYYVVNSLDPNEKEVWPQQVEPGYTGWLNYTIHFQNVGTAPAFNIRLVDSLDANLDWSTFRVSGYSHGNVTSINANGHIVAQFPNILLPDSLSDPEGSKGYIQFKIKPKPNLPMGHILPNKAYIYFDFNAPILTNTAETSFDGTVSRAPEVNLIGVTVAPNPGTGLFRVNWDPSTTSAMQIEVRDLSGRLIERHEEQGKHSLDLDLSQAPTGIYLLTLRSGNSFASKKVIKIQ